MRNGLVFLIISLVFLFYGTLNYYIGLRGVQAFGSLIPNHKLYWSAFWLISLAYLAGRFGQKLLPDFAGRALTMVGAYWLAAMFYFILILGVLDLIMVLDHQLGFLPGIKHHPWFAPAAGLVVLVLVLGVVGYGSWNARHPRVHHYDVTIAKPAGSLGQLHIVMVSDIHLGTIIHNGRLNKMVDMVNELKPDLVLLPGDVIDEDIGPSAEQQMAGTLKKVRAKYGVFAVPGNHEYISGRAEDTLRCLEKAGVRILRDRYLKVAGCFYVVGRDDRMSERFQGQNRLELPALMQGVDRSLPVFLLDHQPFHLSEAQEQGIDLLLSGHTHLGQLFPVQLITRRIFEIDWGYLRKGDFQVIVSSGFGTWGPPIRVGNTPEIVDIMVRFTGGKAEKQEIRPLRANNYNLIR